MFFFKAFMYIGQVHFFPVAAVRYYLSILHGPASAADLIDKYVAMVENSLVGDSRLHERTGDEIMIVSTSPDALLAASRKIMKNAAGVENILQVHGGLHLGKVLKRNNSYFGSAINVTSRIAASAGAGTFLCSEKFVNALSEKPVTGLRSAGKHTFKNISEEKDIFEIADENDKAFADTLKECANGLRQCT